MDVTFIGLDHIQLAAPEGCEEAARAFYSGLLGWREISKPEGLLGRGGVWFQCGAHQVHIGVQKDFVPATKAHPAFLVQHLQELRTYLAGRQAAVIEDDARSGEGIERFFMTDPFGNRLEFVGA
jgi:catechol 2,3-dioxygenase-like lactoylglutathione lyase family enzyme